VNAGRSVRNRSEIVAVSTPRGPVEVAHQQMRPLGPGKPWEWVWVARRRGQKDWRWASTAREAIRQATLLAAGKKPAWLTEAAAAAERQIATGPADKAVDGDGAEQSDAT
jgi:hypothetical protein